MEKKKSAYLLALSIMQIIIPLPCALLMTFLEAEKAEAIVGGLLLGWAIGAIMGIIFLIINKKYQMASVKYLSIIAIIPICVIIVLFSVMHSYKFTA